MSKPGFDMLDFLETLISSSAALAEYRADPEAYLLRQNCPPDSEEFQTLVGLGALRSSDQGDPASSGPSLQVSTVMAMRVPTSPKDPADQVALPIKNLSLELSGAEQFVVHKGQRTYEIDQERSVLTYDPATASVAFALVLVLDSALGISLTITSGEAARGKHEVFPSAVKVGFAANGPISSGQVPNGSFSGSFDSTGLLNLILDANPSDHTAPSRPQTGG